MKKRFISLALAGMMILALLPMLVGAAEGESTENAALTLSTKNSQVAIKDGTTKGQTATVEVHLDKNPGIVSATIPVAWDTTALKLIEVDYNDSDCVIPTGWCGAAITEEIGKSGKYYLAWNNDTMCKLDENGEPVVENGKYVEESYTGTGKLCTLKFEVLKDIELDKPIPALTIQAGEDEKLFTIMSWGMDDYVNDGIADVTINDNGEISAVEKVVLPGDLNEDGIVNYNDAIYLLYYSYGVEGFDVGSIFVDYNKDNLVNYNDAIYLLYHSYGIDGFPIS